MKKGESRTRFRLTCGHSVRTSPWTDWSSVIATDASRPKWPDLPRVQCGEEEGGAGRSGRCYGRFGGAADMNGDKNPIYPEIVRQILAGDHDADLSMIQQAAAYRLKSIWRKGMTLRLTGTDNPDIDGETGVIVKVNQISKPDSPLYDVRHSHQPPGQLTRIKQRLDDTRPTRIHNPLITITREAKARHASCGARTASGFIRRSPGAPRTRAATRSRRACVRRRSRAVNRRSRPH
jgi:hypothetical protein